MTVTDRRSVGRAHGGRTRTVVVLLEFVGTLALAMVATGAASGARALSGQDPGSGWLVGSLAVGGAVLALGLALGGVSLHPLVTLLDLVADRIPAGDAAARILAQALGALAGGALGLWSFYGVRGLSVDHQGIDGLRVRDLLVTGVSGGLLIGLVVGAVLAQGRHDLLPVGTALGSTAVGLSVDHVTWGNPALALARIVRLPDLVPTSVPLVWVAVVVVGQVVGAAAALVVLRLAGPDDGADDDPGGLPPADAAH